MSRRDRRWMRTLQTADGRSPRALAIEATQVVAEAAGAEFGLSFGLALVDGRPHYDGLECVGDGVTCRRVEPLRGARLLQNGMTWPHVSSAVERRRFLTLRGVISESRFKRTEAYRRVYGPLSVADQARLLIYDGRRFVAFVGAWRLGRGRSFSSADCARLTRLIEPLSNRFVLIDHLAREALGEDGDVAVFNARGRVVHASRDACAWLTHDRIAPLAHGVRRMDRGDATQRVVLDGAVARIVRVDGDDGVRYVVTLTASVRPVLQRASELSPIQRSVAKYAVSGATCEEIAAAVGCRPNTVRAHMKEIYRRLGVTSRLELAQVLSS